MPILDELKAAIAKRLPELDVVIGWGKGFDALHHTPVFITSEADLDKLELGPLSVQNLATYLTRYPKTKKIGVVVKGCDSRSVVQLLQEKLINRENVVVFGFPCEGVVDLEKVKRAFEDQGMEVARVSEASFQGERCTLTSGGKAGSLPMAGLWADKCNRCQYHDAVISDEFAGQRLDRKAEDAYADVAAFEAKPLAERQAFWQEQMSRCIRCYACRNACPLCVCRDQCIAQTREPNWVSQRTGVEEKFMFQMIHASHLAGRCTECGECERACPVGIPILLLKRKNNKEILELFDYRAGIDPEAKPPLLAFKVEEEKINERGW
ncbi:MAG: 4Fe-4S dicluster domain-containing protein [Acidobacteriota bacterium]